MRATTTLGCFSQPMLIIALARRRIAFTSAGDDFGIQVENLLQIIAKRLANPDRLRPQTRRKAANGIIRHHVARGQPRAGGKPIAHDIGNQLGPALAPKIAGGQSAIRQPNQLRDMFRAR